MNFRMFLSAVVVFVFTAVTSAHSYSVKDVANGGSLKGKITFSGKAPDVTKIPIEKNIDVCGSGVREIPEVHTGGGGLQYAVVYFEKIDAGKAWLSKTTKLSQKTCTFNPWVQVMANKSELEVVNSDPVLHNIHTYELIGKVRVTIFNEAQPTQGYTFKKKIKMRRGNVVKIECDAHNFMHAYMMVLKNPYFAVTATDGTYSIDKIPPGKYKVTTWHSKLGTHSQEVEISAGGAVTLNHDYK